MWPLSHERRWLVPALVKEAPRGAEARCPAPPRLTTQDRMELLEVAQVALGVATGLRSAPDLAGLVRRASRHNVGRERRAAFVTLFESGELRGCVGTFEPSCRLPESVARAALLAARADPRFWPLNASELPAIQIEISVLGDMVEISDPDSVQLGREGVVVERNGRHGLLLPEVGAEMGLDAPRLWGAVCDKAGMADDAWRDRATRLLVFETVRFGSPT